jgi:N-acetyl-D-muramate 6-phosphate phosphatase
MDIAAVLWDFDGTIIDTFSQHFSINQKIYSLIKPMVPRKEWPKTLKCLKNYVRSGYEAINWRDLYGAYLGFSKEEIDLAGLLWQKEVASNQTPIQIFKGISDVIQKMHQPQGICSQNDSSNIYKTLHDYEIDSYFHSVIGYREISFENQKPDPASFLLCVEKMNLPNEGLIFYIGDHREDVRFAKNAQIAFKSLGKNFRVLSIAACYGGSKCKSWEIQPDFIAKTPRQISSIIDQAKNQLYNFR